MGSRQAMEGNKARPEQIGNSELHAANKTRAGTDENGE
jgi:hypothetical protein